jgi:hypothetical protein
MIHRIIDQFYNHQTCPNTDLSLEQNIFSKADLKIDFAEAYVHVRNPINVIITMLIDTECNINQIKTMIITLDSMALLVIIGILKPFKVVI